MDQGISLSNPMNIGELNITKCYRILQGSSVVIITRDHHNVITLVSRWNTLKYLKNGKLPLQRQEYLVQAGYPSLLYSFINPMFNSRNYLAGSGSLSASGTLFLYNIYLHIHHNNIHHTLCLIRVLVIPIYKLTTTKCSILFTMYTLYQLSFILP